MLKTGSSQNGKPVGSNGGDYTFIHKLSTFVEVVGNGFEWRESENCSFCLSNRSLVFQSLSLRLLLERFCFVLQYSAIIFLQKIFCNIFSPHVPKHGYGDAGVGAGLEPTWVPCCLLEAGGSEALLPGSAFPGSWHLEILFSFLGETVLPLSGGQIMTF